LAPAGHVVNMRATVVADRINRDRPLVLFFFCGCQTCHRTAVHLAALSHGRRASNLLGLSSLDPADASQFANGTGFPGAVSLDQNGDVARSYHVADCPTFVVLDKRAVMTIRNGGSPLAPAQWHTVAGHLRFSVPARTVPPRAIGPPTLETREVSRTVSR